MKHGFIKVAAYSPRVTLAAPQANAAATVEAMRRAESAGAKLLVLPELFLSGYSCGDLFFQTKLQEDCLCALQSILDNTKDCKVMTAVGLPLALGNRLYNCAAVLYAGTLLGVVPKTAVPAEEARYFAAAPKENAEILLCGSTVPFGTKQLFSFAELPAFMLGVEICADLWQSVPPSAAHTDAGATVIANLSAATEVLGKTEYRTMLVCTAAAKQKCGYVFASAGAGESTTDLVFGGHTLIAEGQSVLCECAPFAKDSFAVSEIDCAHLLFTRRKESTTATRDDYVCKIVSLGEPVETELTRKVEKLPFLPADRNFDTVLTVQAHGLARRIEAAHAKKAVIGISGGLDSTLALLVAVRAMALLERSASDVLAVTMPCFGTSGRTKNNAEVLCRELGVSYREVDIRAAVEQHFADIGQSKENHDVTFENGQARERTQILMDIANMVGGIVIGTGDLSELALGFATYNGDHRSMYGVNASVPKTLMRRVVRQAAASYRAAGKALLAQCLGDVVDTPISPELLPPKDGEIAQVTEDIVGPYELHDFFLYHLMQGHSPSKIHRLAVYAFDGEYDGETVAKWLYGFVRRFFAQQFKRSCLPDGPQVTEVTLSPRGGYRMPSDACADAFLQEAQALCNR